mmetsp:Transcript_33084/g.84506  ORF Transcript_33084/g.84506 Transcript_33084/m.84506 type:complete len:441 (+) Transcript_33084:103-1425(+)
MTSPVQGSVAWALVVRKPSTARACNKINSAKGKEAAWRCRPPAHAGPWQRGRSGTGSSGSARSPHSHDEDALGHAHRIETSTEHAGAEGHVRLLALGQRVAGRHARRRRQSCCRRGLRRRRCRLRRGRAHDQASRLLRRLAQGVVPGAHRRLLVEDDRCWACGRSGGGRRGSSRGSRRGGFLGHQPRANRGLEVVLSCSRRGRGRRRLQRRSAGRASAQRLAPGADGGLHGEWHSGRGGSGGRRRLLLGLNALREARIDALHSVGGRGLHALVVVPREWFHDRRARRRLRRRPGVVRGEALVNALEAGGGQHVRGVVLAKRLRSERLRGRLGRLRVGGRSRLRLAKLGIQAVERTIHGPNVDVRGVVLRERRQADRGRSLGLHRGRLRSRVLRLLLRGQLGDEFSILHQALGQEGRRVGRPLTQHGLHGLREAHLQVVLL